jgi:orotidine-5'-phosphate decarboxylase
MNAAVTKLKEAQKRTGSLLSIGLEPCPEYLFPGLTPGIEAYRQMLMGIIEGTEGLVPAYKFNIAFFEALGAEGISLLYEIRAKLPEDVLTIIDAKRGDIGSTARCYAKALYEDLDVDSTTVNPLMGRDAAEPFLSYRDKLSFFLVLTSNPSAKDFLLHNNLYRHIAETVAGWNTAGNCGFVVGATQTAQVDEIRSVAPEVPFLVPGVGAQGGSIAETLARGRMSSQPDGFSGLLFHITRGILPKPEDAGDPAEGVRKKTLDWNEQVRQATESLTTT